MSITKEAVEQLFWAAADNNLQEVESLVTKYNHDRDCCLDNMNLFYVLQRHKNCFINHDPGNYSAIFIAAANNHIEMVKYFVNLMKQSMRHHVTSAAKYKIQSAFTHALMEAKKNSLMVPKQSDRQDLYNYLVNQAQNFDLFKLDFSEMNELVLLLVGGKDKLVAGKDKLVDGKDKLVDGKDKLLSLILKKGYAAPTRDVRKILHAEPMLLPWVVKSAKKLKSCGLLDNAISFALNKNLPIAKLAQGLSDTKDLAILSKDVSYKNIELTEVPKSIIELVPNVMEKVIKKDKTSIGVVNLGLSRLIYFPRQVQEKLILALVDANELTLANFEKFTRKLIDIGFDFSRQIRVNFMYCSPDLRGCTLFTKISSKRFNAAKDNKALRLHLEELRFFKHFCQQQQQEQKEILMKKYQDTLYELFRIMEVRKENPINLNMLEPFLADIKYEQAEEILKGSKHIANRSLNLKFKYNYWDFLRRRLVLDNWLRNDNNGDKIKNAKFNVLIEYFINGVPKNSNNKLLKF